MQLALASALSRIALNQRLPVLQGLVANEFNAEDRNLTLMIWYALEPVAAADPQQVLPLFDSTRIPLVREFLARRIANLARTDAKNKAAPRMSI